MVAAATNVLIAAAASASAATTVMLQHIIGRLRAQWWRRNSIRKKREFIWGLGLIREQLIRTRSSSPTSGYGFDFAVTLNSHPVPFISANGFIALNAMAVHFCWSPCPAIL